jgi:hypothetical protein
MEINLAHKLVNNEEKFMKFIISNKKRWISAEFILMIIPIDVSHRALPLCQISSTHSFTTERTIEEIAKVFQFLQKNEIKISGFVIDGDRQYAQCSTRFMNFIIDDIRAKSEQSVLNIINDYDVNCHFFDPFHLVK